MRILYLIIIVLLNSKITLALVGGSEILRVCYDNNTKIAVIYTKNPQDFCNSFKYYKVYSNEFNTYWRLVSKETIYNNTQFAASGITDVDAKFKVVTYFACNGLDSFTSNISTIDKVAPAYMEIDSISFDPLSQNLIVGWKNNLSRDTKGYWLYKNVGSINSKIVETEKNSSLLSSYNELNPSNISLASFDSCNNFSPISNSQRACYLKGFLDSCKREIKLVWNKYTGWQKINQFLYLKINSSSFFKYTDLTLNDSLSIITGINMGDKLCYFVKTENLFEKKTSSSNIVCFNTRKMVPPTINYLSNASVENNAFIKISYTADIAADTDSLIFEKSENSTNVFTKFNGIKFINSKSRYEINDYASEINSTFYTYRVITIDKCGSVSSISNPGTSIFLSSPLFENKKYSLTWNNYLGWEKGIYNQKIETSNDRFTWNLYKNELNGIEIITYGFQNENIDSICIRISNIEQINVFGTSSTSVSNIRCIYSISDYYLPGTINPLSNNNIFRLYGKGYDKSRGKIEIFNRWGGKVYETADLERGWDGKINDSYADQGIYIYKVYFYDQQNKYYLKTGSLQIIR